jgi:4-amino-4-deoxy-L-arabinose transferase-like glycosyltransferase
MLLRRSLWLIAVAAAIHAVLFIIYLRPAWDVSWSDQEGYKRLGAVLAATGTFTRYPDYATFVPEVIRTPGYPVFVALIYRLFGIGNDLAVTLAQAVVFAAICLMVYSIGRQVRDERTAIVAAALTALFAPLPHFAALVLTELWTAFVATAAMLMCVRAVQGRRLRDFAIAGALLSATTLVRPAFVLLPFFIAAAMPLCLKPERNRRALGSWAVLCVSAALTLLPWFTYNYVNLGRFTLSPAGGIGRGLWEGAWQGRWPGRVQAELTQIATDETDVARRQARVARVATDTGYPADQMLEYVHEWRTIHDVWDTPTDPLERAQARVLADQMYLRAAVAHIEKDPLGHAMRRVTRGAFVLWAAEVPIRYTDINQTPTWVIRVIWLVQIVLLVLAAAGFVVLIRTGRRREAILLALPLVYVTGVHLPLLCEARQSLPVKPLVLVLAAVAMVRTTYPETSGS